LSNDKHITSEQALKRAIEALRAKGYDLPIYRTDVHFEKAEKWTRRRRFTPRPDRWSIYVEFDIREMIQQGKPPFAEQGDYHVFVDVEMDGTVSILEYPDVPEDRIIFPEDE